MNTQYSKIMRAPGFAMAGILISALCGIAIPFSAEAASGSGGIAADSVTLTHSSDFQTLISVPLGSSGATRLCQVVASLDAVNPGGDGSNAAQTYTFTISLDNLNPVLETTAGERVIELRDQPNVNDPNVWPVATNDFFSLTPNVTHTLRLQGRKGVGAPNMVVDDAIITSLCI